MNTKVMQADQVRSDWRDVMDEVSAGKSTVLVQRYKKPVVAVISYDDFLVLQERIEYLEDLEDARKARAEYERDPSTAISVQEMIAALEHDHGEEKAGASG
jgi:prevent-host-death family protein